MFQEGASEEDINSLARFKYRRVGSKEKSTGDKAGTLAGVMTMVGSSENMTERSLYGEDAVSTLA